MMFLAAWPGQAADIPESAGGISLQGIAQGAIHMGQPALRHTALRVSGVYTLKKDSVTWDEEKSTRRVFLHA